MYKVSEKKSDKKKRGAPFGTPLIAILGRYFPINNLSS